MRGALVTLLVGLLAVGAALGGGWAVQAAALPPPQHGARAAADAASWLLRYRLTRSSFEIGSVRDGGYCLHTWFPRRDGKLARGTLLTLGDGLRVFQNGGPIRFGGVPQREPARLAMLQFELAGCPAVLGTRLAVAAQSAEGIRVQRAFAAGQPALALRLPTLHDRVGRHRYLLDRLTLYVSASTWKPLLVKASLGGLAGSGRIYLTPATAALLSTLTGPVYGRGAVRP